MNKNKIATWIAVDDYERLEKIVAHQAFMNCEHANKRSEKCVEKQECYQQGILDFLFEKLSRLN